jgi:urea transporter
VDGSENVARETRILVLSGLSAFIAPFVFVSIIVLRKVNRRVNVQARFYNKRLRRELARWS